MKLFRWLQCDENTIAYFLVKKNFKSVSVLVITSWVSRVKVMSSGSMLLTMVSMSMPKTTITDALRSEIYEFFKSMDEESPKVAYIIGVALLGYEHCARRIHETMFHKTSFASCPHTMCSEANRELNDLYQAIIKMRRAG